MSPAIRNMRVAVPSVDADFSTNNYLELQSNWNNWLDNNKANIIGVHRAAWTGKGGTLLLMCEMNGFTFEIIHLP